MCACAVDATSRSNVVKSSKKTVEPAEAPRTVERQMITSTAAAPSSSAEERRADIVKQKEMYVCARID